MTDVTVKPRLLEVIPIRTHEGYVEHFPNLRIYDCGNNVAIQARYRDTTGIRTMTHVEITCDEARKLHDALGEILARKLRDALGEILKPKG